MTDQVMPIFIFWQSKVAISYVLRVVPIIPAVPFVPIVPFVRFVPSVPILPNVPIVQATGGIDAGETLSSEGLRCAHSFSLLGRPSAPVARCALGDLRVGFRSGAAALCQRRG